MNPWLDIFGAGDVQALLVKRAPLVDEHERVTNFIALVMLHDGREMGMRFATMQEVACFANELQPDTIKFASSDPVEELQSELATARLRLRGELH